MCANYNVGRRTKRWPMVIFFHLFNVSGINAFVIYKSKVDGNISRRIFLKRLAVDLTKPHQQTRAGILTLPQSIQQRLRGNLDQDGQASTSREGQLSTYKRCHLCRRIKDRKTKTTCTKCRKNVCTQHTSVVCQICCIDLQ